MTMSNVLLKVLLELIVHDEQVNTYISANPNLGPETSESMNFGAIYTLGNHSLAVDFFNTEIDKFITGIQFRIL